MNRRKFVATTGATLTGLSVSQPVLGKTNQTPIEGAEEKGILKPVRKLFRNGKHEQARKLLDKHNVKRDSSIVKVNGSLLSHDPTDTASTNSGGVSTQEYLEKADSEVGLDGYHLSGDLYDTGLWWRTNITNYTFDDWGPNDGAAITWGESRWEYEPGTKHLNECTDFFPNYYGVKVEWDDGAATDYGNITGDVGSSFWVTIEKGKAGTHNLYGYYDHSYDYLQVPGDISYSVGIAGLNVSLSSGTKHWQIPANVIEL